MNLRYLIAWGFIAASGLGCGPGGQQEDSDELGSAGGALGASVKLVKMESWSHHRYGMTQRDKKFTVRVFGDKAQGGRVGIHHQTADGAWSTFELPCTPAGDNAATCEGSYYEAAGQRFGGRFAVRLATDYGELWDNNGGQDYLLGDNDGVILTDDAKVRLENAYLRRDGGPSVSANGSIWVRNLGPAKDVSIILSTDDFRTATELRGSYAGPFFLYGYASVNNPTSRGFEGWSFWGNVGEVNGGWAKAYVKYTVDGQTYYDNNFGQNYSLQIAP